MRLIDADALAKLAGDLARIAESIGADAEQAACELLHRYATNENLTPTVDAEPARHGRWERKNEAQAMFDVEWRCSECGGEISTNGIYTPIAAGWYYCPTCGAKMDGGNNDDH